jgi:hypothetical protein
MKRKLVLMMGMLLWLGLFCACSKSEDVSDLQKIEECLSFYLFHEDGGESLIFKKGEPLVFQLAFETPGNPVLSQDLKEGDLIADKDLFSIYRENGEKVGLPQRDRIELTTFETAVGPYVFRYIWSTQNGDVILESGNYYTQFSIMYNTYVGESGDQMEREDIKVNFIIQ